MRTKQKDQMTSKKKNPKQSFKEKDECFRTTFDDYSQDLLYLQGYFGGTLDPYIKDRIHAYY